MSESATLEWRDGQPVSARFGDVYFSRNGGLDETRHVFLHHNDLERRWRSLESGLFTIAETGFGTGLNFLCAWQLWQHCAPAQARLHFVSTELYPLTHADLETALSLWPELAPFSQALLAQYRMLAPGWRRLHFDRGRVTLTLLIGDARETLPRLRAHVDTWFLDGFSPAKNPELWQPELLAQIKRLAAPGCTFSTFTSAGVVRRGLEAAGFLVEKVAGHGSKRDMLRGRLSATTKPAASDHRAIVIGGGIAGCASAHSLAVRGWQVSLIERHAGLAQEASGNLQGVLYPRLSGHDIPLSRVAQLGFMHTLGLLETFLNRGQDWDDCGLLQQAFNTREAKRIEEVLQRGLPEDLVQAVERLQAAELAGIEMPHGGLWFPHGGWVHPPALCRALATHASIQTQFNSAALSIEFGQNTWQVRDGSGVIAEAPVVIVCGANDSQHFSQTAHLPLEAVRGQVSHVTASAASSRLRAVVCTEGYISPSRDGMHCLGATFGSGDCGLDLRDEDHAENLATLRQISPQLHDGLGDLAAERLTGRVALRCVTPDYLPMAGPLLDADETLSRYEPGSRRTANDLPWLDGLYLNTGHGSKGMLTAPLCAELIAARLGAEPLPMDSPLAAALDPNRFLLRPRGLKRLIGAAYG